MKTQKKRRAQDSLTVADVARQMAPDWKFPNDWLAWPPDVFALTSTVMRLTGCYRIAVATSRPRHNSWQRAAERCAGAWMRHVGEELKTACGLPLKDKASSFPPVPSRFADACDLIAKTAATTTLAQLRTLGRRESRRFADALLTLHATADEACTGLGLVGPGAVQPSLVRCLANLLLTATGSLSAIGKDHGVVLPKMRTPQSGLTLRSVSHQLTLHSGEVEVMWRTIPWANVHQNTINLFLVPWPVQVDEHCFATTRDTLELVRYFRYCPSADGLAPRLRSLVDSVVAQERQRGRLHLIVFPELALDRLSLRQLLALLRDRHLDKDQARRLQHVPMVVCGVHSLDDGRQSEDEEQDDPRDGFPRGTPTPDELAPGLNEVILATYFADRWYEISQLKHHRWKLDRNQIRQYGLEGRLSTARSWFEHIKVSQRRLTFLAPTPWLTLCPLICEDLAQLEPISDLIRGVGPTLLTALLMDGPQLKERWSARYASVLADDPGTAVLTFSSIGMVRRSQPLSGDIPGGDTRLTVGLWKDQPTGWRKLALEREDQALLLTISANFTEEFTADGRGDHAFASVFQYDGLDRCDLADPTQNGDEPPDFGLKFGDWADIRQLTAATFVMDCVLDERGMDVDVAIGWFLAKPARGKSRLSRIINTMTHAFRTPSDIGIVAMKSGWPTTEVREAARIMGDWAAVARARCEKLQKNADRSTAGPGKKMAPIKYYECLAEEAKRRLSDASRARPARDEGGLRQPTDHAKESRDRLPVAIALMVLFAIHGRLEPFRHSASRAHDLKTEQEYEEDQRRDESVVGAMRLLQSVERYLDEFA